MVYNKICSSWVCSSLHRSKAAVSSRSQDWIRAEYTPSAVTRHLQYSIMINDQWSVPPDKGYYSTQVSTRVYCIWNPVDPVLRTSPVPDARRMSFANTLWTVATTNPLILRPCWNAPPEKGGPRRRIGRRLSFDPIEWRRTRRNSCVEGRRFQPLQPQEEPVEKKE